MNEFSPCPRCNETRYPVYGATRMNLIGWLGLPWFLIGLVIMLTRDIGLGSWMIVLSSPLIVFGRTKATRLVCGACGLSTDKIG